MKIDNQNQPLKDDQIQSIMKALQLASNDLSFLDTLFNIIPNPIFYKNDKGVYKFCNQAFCNYLGLDRNSIVDHTVFDIAPINLANTYHQADLDLMQSQENQTYESQVRYFDGTLHDVVFYKNVHLDDSKQAVGLVGLMVDITTQKNNERLILRQNIIKDVLLHINQSVNQEIDSHKFFSLLLSQLVTAMPAAEYGTILSLDDEKNLSILVNLGYLTSDSDAFNIPLQSSFIWLHSKGNLNVPCILSDLRVYFDQGCPPPIRTLDGRRIQSSISIPIKLHDDTMIILSLESPTLNAFTNLDLSVAEYIQLQIPIIYQIFALNKRTITLSRYDSLTGLMNRGYFNIIFEDRITLARRHNSMLSVIMFDLDGLKIINDNFGHAAGDLYLEHFAKFINTQFRSSDTFARIGGDEFLGIFSTTDAITLKKKMTLLQTLYTELPIDFQDTSFFGRFSYGIATFPVDADTIDGLLTVADIKMYRDKKNETD